MNMEFPGLSSLFTLIDGQSRAVSPENRTGGKGEGGRATTGTLASAARELGVGWKLSPSLAVPAGETVTLADIEGEGLFTQLWMTGTAKSWRQVVLRFYWDGAAQPSVECPLGDFFANPAGYQPITSLAVCVNPRQGMNCYWPMPFRSRARITLQNLTGEELAVFYQFHYTLRPLPDSAGYFHAQFRRVNPLPYKEVYTVLDRVHARGQYVGTALLWGAHHDGWWGEGEFKFYLDGDTDFPTICGTGTEDYFGGAWDFRENDHYAPFTGPYTGFCPLPTDGLYHNQPRFSLYRWHITDPICFSSDLRVTVQALGWRSGGRYLPRQDDISSVAYWYQDVPAEVFPPFPTADELEIV